MNMKKTRIALIGAAVVLLAAALMFFWMDFGQERVAEQPPASSQTAGQNDAESSAGVHDQTNADDDPDPIMTKEDVVNFVLDKAMREYRRVRGGELPKNERAFFRKLAIEAYNKGVKNAGRLPRRSEVSFTPWITPPQLVMADYDGPQTVEALIAEFDADYSQIQTSRGSEIDEVFPRKEWIQRALDLGVVFLDNYDYSGIMQVRARMARIRSNPERYAELIQAKGLEDNANYNAFIDKEIMHIAQDNIMWRAAMRKDPDSTSGFRLGNRYITTRDNQVHLKITPGDPSHSTLMYGPRSRDLTDEETHLLKYHGVAPEDIEVFYIDENNEVMPPDSEPMRLDWKDRVAAMSEHKRQEALQEAVEFLNSDLVNQMTIVDWMTMADYTGALLDYTEGGRTGVSAAPPEASVPPAPSGVAAPSEVPSEPHERALPPLLPPGVELPQSPGRSAEDVDAFFQFLDLHLIENADVPEEVRRGLKQRYEAYQMWRQQDRLRRQEQDSLRRQDPPPAPQDEEEEDE